MAMTSDDRAASDAGRIPEGFYAARVAGVEQRDSKSSGKPMLVVTLRIKDGDWKGAELLDYIPFHVDFKIHDYLRAVGIQPDTFSFDHANGEDELGGLLLGKVVRTRVVHDSYEFTDSDGERKTGEGVKPRGVWPTERDRPLVAAPVPERDPLNPDPPDKPGPAGDDESIPF